MLRKIWNFEKSKKISKENCFLTHFIIFFRKFVVLLSPEKLHHFSTAIFSVSGRGIFPLPHVGVIENRIKLRLWPFWNYVYYLFDYFVFHEICFTFGWKGTILRWPFSSLHRDPTNVNQTFFGKSKWVQRVHEFWLV